MYVRAHVQIYACTPTNAHTHTHTHTHTVRHTHQVRAQRQEALTALREDIMQHPQRTPALLRAGGFDTCQGLAALWAENIGTSLFFF